MRVLSFVNQKGGCGKTTTAINLAGALARAGERVLVVDLDPQAHATLGLGVDGLEHAGVLAVLEGELAASSAAVRAPGGIRLLAASPRLAEFEEKSARRLRPEGALCTALEEAAAHFDFVLVDCPARADGVLTANALGAASTAVLVVETGAFALQGALSALRLFEEIADRRELAFDLRVLGTMFDRRTVFARDLLIALQARFGPVMFETAVRSSVRLREAAACGVPITVHAPRSAAAADFVALAAEVLAMPRPCEVAPGAPRASIPGGRLQEGAAPHWTMPESKAAEASSCTDTGGGKILDPGPPGAYTEGPGRSR